MKYVRLTAIIIGVITFIMWLLNPSFTRFKEFSGTMDSYYNGSTKPKNKLEVVRWRVSNYLLWSIYEIGTADYEGQYKFKNRYVGVLMNFFDVTPPTPPTSPLPKIVEPDYKAIMDTSTSIQLPPGFDKLDTAKDGLPIIKKK